MTPNHHAPLKLNAGKASAALGDPDTPALVLLTIAMHTFGDGVLGDPEGGVEPMDPSELWAGLNEVFGTWVTEEGENKLNALIMALQGDLFYRDVEVFQAVCAALPDGDLGDLLSEEFTDLTAADVMWSVLEVELARDQGSGVPEFSSGVGELITSVMAGEQEDQASTMQVIQEEFHRMLDILSGIGVPTSAIRMLDAEYADAMESLDVDKTPGASSVVGVS